MDFEDFASIAAETNPEIMGRRAVAILRGRQQGKRGSIEQRKAAGYYETVCGPKLAALCKRMRASIAERAIK